MTTRKKTSKRLSEADFRKQATKVFNELLVELGKNEQALALNLFDSIFDEVRENADWFSARKIPYENRILEYIFPRFLAMEAEKIATSTGKRNDRISPVFAYGALFALYVHFLALKPIQTTRK